MKRSALAIIATLALTAGLTVPSAVGAPTPRADAAPTAAPITTAPAARGDTVYVHATLAWVRNNTIGMSFGPSRRTGYGKVTITGIVKGCPECNWYRATLDYTNHQPTSPMQASSAGFAQKRRSGFCWPWEFDFFSGDSCWNDASTWNWGAIISPWDDNWHPWNPDALSITDRLVSCMTGTEAGVNFKLAGAGITAVLESGFGPLNITPEGWIVAGVGGCTGNPFHN
ncbi:MAG: hypothetical protein QOI15_3015 [Pseudonocardiales bacterium]|jgi:hypothetical protein|nr:hypothetical protein [Pseudonocardiales bacterium]